MTFLGCFSVLLPGQSRSRARALLVDMDVDDLDEKQQLIDARSDCARSEITSASVTGSHAGTVTSASSFRGIGSLSGKAIMAVGSLVIKGIEVVDIRVRLRRIAVQLGREGDGLISEAAMDDLFEFQRSGLYPHKVRRRAMELVVLLMCRSSTHEQLVQTLIQQPLNEIHLFLEQLCSLKFNNRIPSLELDDAPRGEYQEKRPENLSDRLFDLILSSVKMHPSLLLDGVDSVPVFELVLYLCRTGRTSIQAVLAQWDGVDVQRYVSKLNRYRFSGWVSHTNNLDHCPFLKSAVLSEPYEFPRPSHPQTLHVFCHFVSDIVLARPPILCMSLSGDELSDVLALLFESARLPPILSTLLASNYDTAAKYMFRLARGERRHINSQPGGFLIDLRETQDAARVLHQARFATLLQGLRIARPDFLHRVFTTESFTTLIVNAVDDPDISPAWTYPPLLLKYLSAHQSLLPLRACYVQFLDSTQQTF
ncbi:hypothetical protein BXZ70DRAFT_661161 [Cristinia sonorae]|uniref:Uncharacterized protein n=1 Tax=Cristinia sonorae TaxID=1940300 RepID=A0A8K0XJY5_9AGAR|nr:hypothetical protein BXZ70DRAFT_661161 [Cristinia sonorae]